MFRYLCLSWQLASLHSTPVAHACEACEAVWSSSLLQVEEPRSAVKDSLEDLVLPPTKDGEVLVPHILHQSWKNSEIPRTHLNYTESWHNFGLSDWKHILWTDQMINDTLLAHYPWFRDTYDALPNKIMRVDVVRAMMLHRHGGVYADLDVEVLKDPRPLFRQQPLTFFFAPKPGPYSEPRPIPVGRGEGRFPELGNRCVELALLASPAGHPFWLTYLNEVQRHVHAYLETGHRQHVFWVTGPIALTRALTKYMHDSKDRNAIIFHSKYWYPYWGPDGALRCDRSAAECRAKYPEAYLYHHYAHRWPDGGLL